MAKSSRLIQMIMWINAKRSFTAQEMADEFGLSVRTVTRDLQELSALGVPVYSVQGRGGGYKLLRERVLPPISFSESEATALFFAAQSLEFFGSHPFGEVTGAALQKFYHYLPADKKEQIDRLKGRVMFWSPYRPMSPDILQTLLQAVMGGVVVTIDYNSASGVSKRDIQPVGLYASDGYWYCPAYCFVREEVRQFRADRMLSAAPNEAVRPREEVRRKTVLGKPSKAHLEQAGLRVELTKKGVWLLESNPRFAPFIRRREDGGGIANVRIAAEDLFFYADLVWGLGSEAKITEPPEAVAYIGRKLEAMRALYG
ncbi:helix-turn-helix transcriptional regulator [Cohnella massiliensis]|uniref:helix-turn-helix transcriptional regulator n=1 Tax=Cohnella massiliensis TaxID=1816691 RepID=UPI0009B95178|nr:YafY family protein [Cohnella massiliensis]